MSLCSTLPMCFFFSVHSSKLLAFYSILSLQISRLSSILLTISVQSLTLIYIHVKISFLYFEAFAQKLQVLAASRN